MNYNKIIANLRQIWAHLRSNGLALADFEDAINEAVELVKKKRDGLLIEIPCKVGDTVYCIIKNNRIAKRKILGIEINQIDDLYGTLYPNAGCHISFDDIGKTVFLTKEEAAAKLKEMKENG